MPTLFCCILNCESESVNSKKRKIFYRFPQNPERKQLWFSQIGDRIKYGTISSNSRICNSHFATGKPNLDSSHVDYVPTIFPWSTKEEKAKSYQLVDDYESKIKELEQKILAKAFLNVTNETKNNQEISGNKGNAVPQHQFDNEMSGKNVSIKITNNNNNNNNKSSSPDLFKQNQIATTMTTTSSCLPIDNLKTQLCKDGFQNYQGSSTTLTTYTDSNNCANIPLNSNLLQYLLNTLTRVGMAGNNNIKHESLSTTATAAIAAAAGAKPLSINISMPTCPLNLSQASNKIDEQNATREPAKSADLDVKDCTPLSRHHRDFSRNSGNNSHQKSTECTTGADNCRTATQRSVSNNVDPNPKSPEENARSCTCTKSSCLKLYCECFANGNLCCPSCTCINCRNNENFKEERAKVVNVYLERDPMVFSSKIDHKDVSKKHSKGCNCLKSSCLKNYCECFENKVFCSNLCRCRMCCNTVEHMQHQNRDETKMYASSHTSESISVMSDNSPRDVCRKRRKSSVKTTEIYEDVSSNESDEETNAKRHQIDVESISLDDRKSTRSVTSMDIPPVLPQEDDFTEEELALMLKLREQRIEKSIPSIIKQEAVQQPLQSATAAHSSSINIPGQIDSNLLLSLSKSLAVTNLAGFNVVSAAVAAAAQEQSKPADLLSMLVSQQLMVPASNSYGSGTHIIPINLASHVSSHENIQSQLPPAGLQSTPTSDHQPKPSAIPMPPTAAKVKLSTEDYVRRHIEAAERAVRADNLRKETLGYKKPIAKQKVKIEPFASSAHKLSPNVMSTSTGTKVSPLNHASRAEQPAAHNGSTYKSPSSMAVYNWITLPTSTSQSSKPPSDAASTVTQTTCKADQTAADVNSNKLIQRKIRVLRSEIRAIKMRMMTDGNKIRQLERSITELQRKFRK